jgi:hypothetical protein
MPTGGKKMIAFKSCPRCRGDLHIGQEDVSCLQCGYELRPAEKQDLIARLADRQRRLPIAA